jgi:DNA-binding CsgD family transcriptional regulator
MSYKETSAEMGISIKTLKTHMGRVYEKTGAVSNVALSLLFRETMKPGPDHTKVR